MCLVLLHMGQDKLAVLRRGVALTGVAPPAHELHAMLQDGAVWEQQIKLLLWPATWYC